MVPKKKNSLQISSPTARKQKGTLRISKHLEEFLKKYTQAENIRISELNVNHTFHIHDVTIPSDKDNNSRFPKKDDDGDQILDARFKVCELETGKEYSFFGNTYLNRCYHQYIKNKTPFMPSWTTKECIIMTDLKHKVNNMNTNTNTVYFTLKLDNELVKRCKALYP